MKPKGLLLFIVFATVGWVEAQAESDAFSAYIYRHGQIEDASSCSYPQRMFTPPQFSNSKILRNLDTRTLEIGKTFWQLDVVDSTNPKSYLAIDCNGEKFFVFQVYHQGSMAPVKMIGVSENDTSIFNSARRLTDKQAAAKILHRPELTDAVTTNQVLGVSSKMQISPAQIETANNQAVALTHDPKPVVLKPVGAKSSEPSATPPSDLMNYYHRVAAWSGRRNTYAWTQKAVQVLTANWDKINRGRDWARICHIKSNITSEKKMACILRTFTDIAQYESGFNPHPKDFRENSGDVSRGLFSMSIDQCPNARSVQDLYDPLVNIECAGNVFARLIASGGYVSGPSGNRGAAANWSCLQEAHKVFVKSVGHSIKVGFKQQILQFASSYDRIL